MSNGTLTLLATFSTVGVVVLIVVNVRLFLMLKNLIASFSKLGFVLREDAKKYFDEAAGKLVDTNEQFRENYVGIVEQGTKGALHQTAKSIEGSIVNAQQEANKIILRARDDARRINVEARKMAVDEMARSLENAADTISWVLERYVNESFSVDQHKFVIDQLVSEYINEYKT